MKRYEVGSRRWCCGKVAFDGWTWHLAICNFALERGVTGKERTMKALSIQPYYATMIALGFKWIELRSWKTDYRGWILICASKAINKEEKATLMNGHAVAIAELTDVRPYDDKTDREDALLYDDESFEGYSWIFNRMIPVKPFPVKGQLRLFEVDCEIDDLEAIELDYSSEKFPYDLLSWWKENGFIENMSLMEG